MRVIVALVVEERLVVFMRTAGNRDHGTGNGTGSGQGLLLLQQLPLLLS
jgi:hypothetical protein